MNGESFFDELNNGNLDKFSLWKKLSPQEVGGPPPDKIVFQGWLCRTEAGSESLKERFFVVTNDRIYYKKKPTDLTFKGYLSLGIVRLVCPKAVELESKDQENNLRLRFIQNLKFSDLFARSKVELETWLNVLTTRVVRTDFHDRFKVRAVIGKGAFGKVYLASDASGKDFAVKAFTKEVLQKQSRGRSALINEVDILRGLDNPNIMRLYEVHETTNSIYLVCEFLSGGTLTDYLRSSPDFLPDQAVLVLILGLLSAVANMAANGIVHRDLKPENIILKSMDSPGPGEVKVVDYGLATRIDSEYLYTRCGTPGYVSPEVIASEGKESTFRVNSKADIFAVGVIAYLMFTGEPPFESSDAKQTLKRTLECKVNFNHPRLQDKNPAILDLLRGMLANIPSQRLSAREALRSDVFKEFDYKPYQYEECPEEEDLAAMDEDCRVSETIRSLEQRSIAIKKSAGSGSGVNSIKIEIDDTTRASNSQNSGNLLKKSLLKRMASNHQANIDRNSLKIPLTGGDLVDASPCSNFGFLSPAMNGNLFALRPSGEEDVIDNLQLNSMRSQHTQSATNSPMPIPRIGATGTSRQCSIFHKSDSVNVDGQDNVQNE